MAALFQTQAPIGYQFGSTPEDVRQSANAEAQLVINKITAFRESAAQLEAAATALIQDAANFQTDMPDAVRFDTDLQMFSLRGAAPVQFPGGLFQYAGEGETGNTVEPRIKLAEFKHSAFTKPSTTATTFGAAPSAPSPQSAPADVQLSDVVIPDPPQLTIRPPTLLAIGSPPTAPTTTLDTLPATMDIATFQLQDVPALDSSALTRMEAALERKFERSTYDERVLGEAMIAVDRLLSGDWVFDIDALEAGVAQNVSTATNRHARLTSTIWTRRGFSDTDRTIGYNQRVGQRAEQERLTDAEAAKIRWRMKLLPQLIQLSTEAHETNVEMIGELYDYDFELLATDYTALQGLYQLAVARFQLSLAEMEADAARYRGQAEYIIANAERVELRARMARSVGALNRAQAAAYAAEQNAQGLLAESHEARVSVAEAVVQAYETKQRARTARAQALRVELLRYQTQLATWRGSVRDAETQFQVSRSQNRAVAAQNRARAAQLRISAQDEASVAQEARQEAMRAIAAAAELEAAAANRSAKYTSADIANAQEGSLFRTGVTNYQIEAAQFIADLANNIQLNSSAARINSSVSSTYEEIGRNAVRAAEITQQSRSAIAEAYNGLYEAIGRADAARVAGELSKYRASLALRASGDVDYSSQVAFDTQHSTDVTNSGSNTHRTAWTALEES